MRDMLRSERVSIDTSLLHLSHRSREILKAHLTLQDEAQFKYHYECLDACLRTCNHVHFLLDMAVLCFIIVQY